MDLNKVCLMGHLGKDPSFHAMSNGTELAKFSIATTRKWKDKETGERKEDTAWHNIVVFNSFLVDICHAWLQKGTRVYLEGELKTRSYQKEGNTYYITEVIIPQIKGELFVVEKGKGWDTNETPGADRRGGSGGPQQAGAAAGKAMGGSPPDDFDDDIPF